MVNGALRRLLQELLSTSRNCSGERSLIDRDLKLNCVISYRIAGAARTGPLPVLEGSEGQVSRRLQRDVVDHGIFFRA